uniref:Putative grancalcin n=2 Tax=Davidia involucrata TaxID=16924 RepID=A0A5B6Z1E9_DAVIN
MSGYPHNPSGYGYGAPPSQPYSSAPYGAPPPGQQPYAPVATPYGAPSAPYAPTGPGDKPPKNKPYGASSPSASGYPQSAPPSASGYPQSAPPSASGYPQSAPPSASGYPQSAPPSAYPPSAQQYGNPFASLVPSAFPPGTDPNVVACFQAADQDGSGLIDDKELQMALSSYNQSFSLRTVHLLMYLFTNTNARKIGPKEFTAVFYSLQNWRAIFERFDRDRSGKIDVSELREALLSLGFAVSPTVLDLLVSKFDKSGGKNKAIEYDNFIECCLTVKGLTEKFREKDTTYSGSATFTYETFMLTVLPFLIA